MAASKWPRTIYLAQGHRLSQLVISGSVFRISPTQSRPQLLSCSIRKLSVPTVLASTLRSYSVTEGRQSSVPGENDIPQHDLKRYWTQAGPDWAAKWENSLLLMYGPEFRGKLSSSDQEMLAKLQTRRKYVREKQREVLGEEEYRKFIDRADLKKNTGRRSGENNDKHEAHVSNSRDSVERYLADFVSDKGVRSKAAQFVTFMFTCLKLEEGHTSVTNIAQNNFGFERKGGETLAKTDKELGKQHWTWRRRFLENLRTKIEATDESGRNAESMELALHEAQQEALAEKGISMTEEEMGGFRLRVKEQKNRDK